MDKYLDSFREMISLRGLTDHTLTSYCTYIGAYLKYLTDILHKQPEDVTWQDLRDYVNWLKTSKALSDRTINAAISQLRFFTMYVLHKPWDVTQLPRRKFDTYIPYVPSKKELLKCISEVPDLKEQAMLALMYSSGLRLGEVCSLRYEDIDRNTMRIYIHHGKNRSSRYAILSKNALDLLTKYWFECGKPREWLFPCKYKKDTHYNPNALSNRFVSYRKRYNWNPKLTMHSFRHAFGTHLYESGADILTIKELLGHKSISSTAIYIHLADYKLRNVKSPFDMLGGDFLGNQ